VKGRRLPFAISIVLTLLGVFLLIIGPADARVGGAIVVLFFGVGSLGLMTPLASRRGAETVELVDVGPERGFLLPISRRKQLMTIAASAGMGTSWVLLAALTGAIWIGVIGVLLFGSVALYGLTKLRGVRGIALTPTRVKLLGWGDPELDWDALLLVEVYRQGYNRMFGLTVRDGASVRGQRRSLLRRFRRNDVAFPAELLATDPEYAFYTVMAYLDDPERRARLGTQDELSYLKLAEDGGLR
jgi:hypothetical protein